MGAVAICLGIAAAVWLLYRAYLRLQAKGWLDLRGSRGSGSFSAGFLEVQKLLEPKVRHVIRAPKPEKRERRQGEPP